MSLNIFYIESNCIKKVIPKTVSFVRNLDNVPLVHDLTKNNWNETNFIRIIQIGKTFLLQIVMSMKLTVDNNIHAYASTHCISDMIWKCSLSFCHNLWYFLLFPQKTSHVMNTFTKLKTGIQSKMNLIQKRYQIIRLSVWIRLPLISFLHFMFLNVIT